MLKDIEHLRQLGIAETFHQRIEGSFEPLLALDLEIDELYVKFKNTLNEVTKKTVGLRKIKFVDGLTPVEGDYLRREAKKEMLKDPSELGKRAIYSELNREVKKAVKLAKAKSLEEKVLLLEE